MSHHDVYVLVVLLVFLKCFSSRMARIARKRD